MTKSFIVIVITIWLTACGGGSGEGLDAAGRPLTEGAAADPSAAPTDFAAIQASVFSPICTVCHAGGSAPLGLKLDQANSYAMLVGVASVQVPELLRVAPGDPDNSYLIQKLEGTAAVGGQMPLGGPPLDSAMIASVRQWISDGALPPGSATPPATPPTVVSVTPEVDAVVADAPNSISAGFSQAMDASLVSDITFRLTASGGDGTFADGNEVTITAASVTLLNAQSIAMDLTGVSLVDDVYEARLIGTGATALADSNGLILDGDNDTVAGGDFSWRFTLSTASNAPQATWRWIQDNVFTPVCTQCHIDGGIASFMLLDEQNSFGATVDILSSEVPAFDLIEPGDADNSYLVQKLEGTAAVGDQMPLGLPPLDDAVIAAIRDWINAGVPLEPGDPMPGPDPDAEPPVVLINALLTPATGAVEVGFTTSDNTGVTVVRLYVDGLLIGTDNTAPFAIDWDTATVPDGLHVLTAEAEDEAGNIGLSPALDITVVNGSGDSTAPEVTILPVSEPAVGTVTVTVDATDNAAVVSVDLLIDGVLLATRMLPPYQFQWDTTAFNDGMHTLDAMAVDTSDNVGVATSLQVTVDNSLPPDIQPPLVAVITPPNPLSGVVMFNVDASDAGGVAIVRLYVDDVSIGSATVAPYVISWDSLLVDNGAHLLRAEAVDGSGNVGDSDELTINVQNAFGAQPTWRWIQDNIFTMRCIVCHRQGGSADFLWLDEASSYDQLVNASTTEGGPPLRVQPGDPDNSALVQRLEGTLTPRMPLGGTPLSPEEIAAVRAWIEDGALAEIPADITPPTVALISPGSTVSGAINLTANASDDTAIAAVRFYINDQLAGSDTTAPYELSWNTTAFVDGSYEIYAEADDNAGNSASSTTVMVLVDNSLPADIEPPTVSILPPAGAISGTEAISIEAGDNVGVTLIALTADDVLIGTASRVPYSVNWDTLSVSNGDYILIAVANDAAGNSSMSLPVVVTVANTTPVISLELEIAPDILRGDDFPVVAMINNVGAASPPLTATLTFDPPDSVRFEGGTPAQTVGVVPSMAGAAINWLMRADETGIAMITVTVTDQAGDVNVAVTVPVTISD